MYDGHGQPVKNYCVYETQDLTNKLHVTNQWLLGKSNFGLVSLKNEPQSSVL